jgi:hypothetical protein
MPTIAELVSLNNMPGTIGGQLQGTLQPAVSCKDNSGHVWGLFDNAYFGRSDIWVAQSKDGKNWSNPTIAFANEWIWEKMKCSWHKGNAHELSRISISWIDNSKHAHARSVPMRELYLDSDNDGVPDIVERAIGTNPYRADTFHCGIIDGNNKNPLYKCHNLSRNEQIYQAVIEGVCQHSQFVSPFVPGIILGDGPVNPNSPLVIPSGPDIRGVPINGHKCTVLEYSGTSTPMSYYNQHGLTFSKPIVGFDGKASISRTRQYRNLGGMNMVWSYMPTDHFNTWFPYEISPDKRRVRIGVSTDYGKFDVEVDRVDNRWLPVECRLVHNGRNGYNWYAASPLRDE